MPPEIIGMDAGRAVSLLKSLKLDPLVTDATGQAIGASRDEGRVVAATDPPPATNVPKGSTVHVTVR